MRAASSHRVSAHATILLVDDNRDGTLARRSVLEELGYKIVSADCGSEALKIAAAHEFDLVITDFKMSPVDGIELIKRLREQDFRKPIILLTGFAESVGMRPETTGADAVIQKSANEITALVRHTKRLLNTPRKPAGSQRGNSASRTQSKS